VEAYGPLREGIGLQERPICYTSSLNLGHANIGYGLSLPGRTGARYGLSNLASRREERLILMRVLKQNGELVSRISNKMKVAALGGTVAVMFSLGAVPVNAAAWNCPVSGTGKSRSVICHDGIPGNYRIQINCARYIASTIITSRVVYGPWFGSRSGKPSVAWCGLTETVSAAWVSRT